MRKPVVQYVAEYARYQPDKIAVIVDGKETSYGKLFCLVRGYYNFLKKIGVSKKDIIVVRATQTLDYVVVYLAIHLVGAVVAPVEKNISTERSKEIARNIGAEMIISQELIYKETVLIAHDILSVAQKFFEATEKYIFPELENTADILFTTGTTGVSKGVEISHETLVATAENLIYGCQYKDDTVLIVPGPLSHANALRKLFTTLVNGSTIYILNGMLNLGAFFKALEYDKGEIACCLPPAAIRNLLHRSGEKLGEYADRIDFIESASSPLPESDKLILCRLLPRTRLYNQYGSSESASVCMYDYNSVRGLKNCIGLPLPNTTVFIVDENRKPIKSSKCNMGYIACAGSINMKGYVNDTELTKSVMLNGIVYSNDIGYIDDKGYVFFYGRKGDVINIDGFKVAPSEIESVVLEFEGIVECICIGSEHPVYGKSLKLLYVRDNEKYINLNELNKFLVSRLESYKLPRIYEEVDKIKKTYNGKMDRKSYFSDYV